jgi:(E)-4-hydroxy-3-methylbut-2-enyl-diphosphate synthase
MNKYCENLVSYQRKLTKEVMVGSVGVGGKNPIRVQSMTTTPTMDTLKTVEQTIRMVNAGCEIVRITAQGPKEAANLKYIKQELIKRGVHVPLVADIHFNPNAAMEAVKHVEKVRVNPGNFVDTKIFKIKSYTDAEYASEIQKIYDKFCPLVKELKLRNVALRIGTNHGSLSDRIMNKFGDTPLGMVESAFEFARICEDLDYHEFMFSMKSSNPQVMVQVYRLLSARMCELKMNYPLHLGVTEAGEGEDGRTKSALGIGLLLEDGLGDTIRVSLTEEPENEIPVAFKLIQKFNSQTINNNSDSIRAYNPMLYQRFETCDNFGFHFKTFPQVMTSLNSNEFLNEEFCRQIGFQNKGDAYQKKDIAADWVIINKTLSATESEKINLLREAGLKIASSKGNGDVPIVIFNREVEIQNSFVLVNLSQYTGTDVNGVFNKGNVFVLTCDQNNFIGHLRQFQQDQIDFGSKDPVVFKKVDSRDDFEIISLEAAYDLGGPLIDGYGNGIWLETSHSKEKEIQFLFTLLQSARLRVTRTDYISCPSCGRTLFDLQSTTLRIREQTNHLKGIKIAIMGCIVNGPGEMADADFGYVGSMPGKVNLYVGKNLIKRGVDERDADKELIQLIKENGAWAEPIN